MSDVFTWDPAASVTPPAEGAAPATAGVFTWDPVSQRSPSLWDKLKTAYTKTQEITAPVKAQSAEGLQQLGQESKAVVNMFAGVPGGVASVGMDALSRISSLMYGDSPKVAGQKARAVADQVNQDWGKITSALGITQDAKGSKIDALMQWGMEASDKGGSKLEKATKGVLSLETTQSVRDTLLNLLGARGLMLKPKAGATPTADVFAKKPDLEQAAVHETKIQEAAKVSPEAEATVVQDIVTDALARRTRLEQYWAGQKGRTKAPDPWEKTVAALVEETPKVEELKPQEGPGITPKTKLEEGTVIGEAPDLIQSGLDKLRAGELISKEEATAIRRLTPRPGEGTIVDSTGKPFFQRGAVDPDLLVKTLGIMGLGAVAAKVLTDWYSSGGLSGDNSGDIGMALAAGAVLPFAAKGDAGGSLLKRIEIAKRNIDNLGERYVNGKEEMSFADFSEENTKLIYNKIALERELKKWQEGKPATSVEEVHPGYREIPVGTKVLAKHGLKYPEPVMGTVVGRRGYREGEKAYILPQVDFGDGLPRTVDMYDLKKVFGGPAKVGATAALASYAALSESDDKFTNLATGLMGATIMHKAGKFEGVPESGLVEVFRKGGREGEAAAAKIYADTHRQLERTVARWNPQIPAEDIVQMTFEKAFRALAKGPDEVGGFRGDAKLSTWLHGIAQKTMFDYADRGEAKAAGMEVRDVAATMDKETDVVSHNEGNAMQSSPELYRSTEDVASGNDLARRMQDALNKLPDNFRQIFEKVELEGKSYAEAAQELGIPPGTVMSGLARAKERLQAHFRDYVDPRTGKFQSGKATPDFLIGLSTIAGGAALGAALDPQNSVRNAVYGALAGGALGTSAGRGAIKAAIKSPDATLGLISTRLGNIDPSLKLSLRTHELNVLKNIDKMNDTTLPFMQAMKKLKGAEEAAVSRALLNSDVETVKSVPALAATFPAVQKALSQIKTQLKALGRFGEGVTDYFPRNVKDFEGLKKAIGPEAAQGLEKVLLDAEAKMNRKEHRSLTEIEQSIIANRYLYAPDPGSFMPGFAKKRTMGDVPENLQQFYEPPVESLLRYLSGAVNDIETARFFGRDLATNKQGKQVYTDVDGSIGNLTARLLKDGKITQAQSMEIRDILKARFEGGEKGMNPILANIRNMTNAALLGNIASAATQVGDSVTTVFHHGLVPTLQAVTQKIIGQERVTPKQLGLINHIAEELSDMGPTGRLVHFTMKWSGFHAIDMFAKGLGLNAALIKNEKLVMTPEGQAKFRAKYQSAFGEETGKVLDDLKNKRMSDNVETLLFSELSDAQPISKAEMPEMYLAHPNGRFLYQLKTYMLKQVDIVRRESYQEIAKGTPEGILRGTKNLAALATVYAISNVPGDTIKDWIAGREVDPFTTPKLIENIGQTFGINRYAGQQLGQGKVVETLTGMVTPPLRVLQDVAKLDEKTVAYVPFVGRPVYDRYLGGNEKREIYEAISENKGKGKGEPKVKLSPAAKQYLQQKRLEKRQQEMSK